MWETIKAFFRKIGGCQEAEFQKTIDKLKGSIESLNVVVDQQKKDISSLLNPYADSVSPAWLNEGTMPYIPSMSLPEGTVTIEDPREIYSSNQVLKDIVSMMTEGMTLDEKLKWVWYTVIDRITYMYDITEDWQPPIITWYKRQGDCIPLYEEIFTPDGVKTVGELKEGDAVLSYDFENKQFCNRKITKIWEKGVLPVKRVHLRNGQHIDITENHPLWARTTQKESVYEKTYLKDVDLTRWWKRKMPIAVKIPYEVKDMVITEDLCFVLGHFLAEGWVEGSHVCTCGYDIPEKIIPVLESYEIPFSEWTNNSGVPCLRFLDSDFKEFLKKQKSNSFDIHLQEEMFHLPASKLEKILEGHFLGDGHLSNYPDKRGFESNKEIVYSTSSEQLAKDIQRIGLQLGMSFHIWKQEHHGGVGKMPIWRVTYNPESFFLKNYGYDGLSEVSISYVENLEDMPTRDFEVELTHTFVFKNGLISHQCEDGTILFIEMCRLAGIRPDNPFNRCGWVDKKYGHSYPTAVMEDGRTYIFETTLDYHPAAPMLFEGSKYDDTWGVCNWHYLGRNRNATSAQTVAKGTGVILYNYENDLFKDLDEKANEEKMKLINSYWKKQKKGGDKQNV